MRTGHVGRHGWPHVRAQVLVTSRSPQSEDIAPQSLKCPVSAQMCAEMSVQNYFLAGSAGGVTRVRPELHPLCRVLSVSGAPPETTRPFFTTCVVIHTMCCDSQFAILASDMIRHAQDNTCQYVMIQEIKTHPEKP